MRSHLARCLIAVGLFLTSSASSADAQSAATSRPPVTWWGQVALGAGGAADSGFYAGAISAAVQVRHILLMGRIASLGTEDRTRMEEVGILAGVATRPAVFHAGVAAGLGIATADEDSSAIALPIEAQLSWRPIPWAGLGARVFANVSRLGNFGGITVALQVGRLRP